MFEVTEKKLLSWDRVAMAVAEDSHDIHTQVGALLIHKVTGAILSTGFNGHVRGANDKKLPKTRPEKYPYMVHAETNLVYNCAKHGISTNDCILYCTLSPCMNCTRAVWQSGIKEVYFKELYRDFGKNSDMEDLELIVTKPFANTKDGTIFHKLILEPKK